MKKAILAIEPTAMEKPWFPQVGRILRSLQQKGEVGEVRILSIIHPSAFLLPWSWYQSMKHELKNEVRRDIERGVKNELSPNEIRVQTSGSYQSDDIAEAIERYSEKVKAELVIVIGESRSKLSKFLFGSVREEIKKRSKRPLLVINPSNEQKAEALSGIDYRHPRNLVSLSLGIPQPI